MSIHRWVVLYVILIATHAHADEWVSPSAVTVVSPSKKQQAVITPAVNGKSGAVAALGPKDKPATVTFTLRTPWMPVDSVVFDDGTLLTLDNWHSLGHGSVATLYERDGKVRWAKTLVELVGQGVVDSSQRSVSSIWWRKTPLEWTLAKDGKSGLITLLDENQLKLVLRDGSASMVAVATLPDDPQRLMNRARSLANQSGQEAAALAVLDRVIAKDPELLEAVSLAVDIHQRTSDHARAVALLDRVSPLWKTKTGHGIANVKVAWAKSLVELKRPADAERALRDAVTAAPTYTHPAIALATLLVAQNRQTDADSGLGAFVDRLLKEPHLDTYSLADVADFYRARNERPKALALYLKAYKKDQVTNQFLYASLAKLYEEMGNIPAAIRVNEQLLGYFQKMGKAFDSHAKETHAELLRLRAKKRP